MDWDTKELRKTLEGAADVTQALLRQGRELLEDWGWIERRRRVWPWLTALAAVSAVGTFFVLRRGKETAY